MGGFWALILAFPTVVYTALLSVATAYWLFVVIGALDLHIFHIGGHDGGLDGALDGGTLDHAGGDLDHAEGLSFGGILVSLGLRGVPVTFTLSVLILFAWGLSFLAMRFVGPVWPLGPTLLATLVLVGSFLLALPLTALAVRPLAPLFETPAARSKLAFIGRSCRVSTATVDERFGQATCEDGGAGVILQVRYPGPGALKKGDRAVLVDYDHERDLFLVEPVEPVDPMEPLPDDRDPRPAEPRRDPVA